MPEPKDYEMQRELEGNEELPDSSGTWIDRVFWWGWRNVLPRWLQGDEPFAKRVMDQIWIDCPWCLFMRGVTIGWFIAWACAWAFWLLMQWLLTMF